MAIDRTEYRILPNDINKNKKIGLRLPFGNGKSLFSLTDTTETQIYYNLVNLLLTNLGERYHHPTFGTDLREVLFENYTENVANRVKNSITKAINFWLPGIKIIDIVVTDSNTSNKTDILKNGIYVELSFIIDTNANNFRTITLFANQSGKINIVGNS